jgi:DNA polymerase I-like protein with 3'-5' exonuclease and polymerase domains
MACLASDKAMINAIQTGVDLHKLTASKTSHKPMEEVTKEDRQRAKAVNFGLIYGMSAPTLKKYAWFNYGVRMTEQEAQDTRDAFFELYEGIAKWHTTTWNVYKQVEYRNSTSSFIGQFTKSNYRKVYDDEDPLAILELNKPKIIKEDCYWVPDIEDFIWVNADEVISRSVPKVMTYFTHDYKHGFGAIKVIAQTTLYGRKRFWPTYKGTTQAKATEFYNSADQGTSADITKLSLIKLYEKLPENAHIIATVHDEIVVECPEAMAEDISYMMRDIMCKAGTRVLKYVPVDAEATVGDSWG